FKVQGLRFEVVRNYRGQASLFLTPYSPYELLNGLQILQLLIQSVKSIPGRISTAVLIFLFIIKTVHETYGAGPFSLDHSLEILPHSRRRIFSELHHILCLNNSNSWISPGTGNNFKTFHSKIDCRLIG